MTQTTVDVGEDQAGVKPPPKKRRTKKSIPARSNTAVKKRGPQALFNWDVVYREFVEGIPNGESEDDRSFPTMKALSERHGMAYQTIRERAAAERWSEKKDSFQAQVVMERQKQHAKKLAKNAAEFDEKSFKIGDVGVNLITMRLVEIAQEAQAKKPVRERAIQNLAAGIPIDEKDLRSAIWSREIEGLANAAERFQNIGMRALGTDVQRHSIVGDINVEGALAPTINVGAEIMRDDPERVAALIKSFGDAGLLSPEIVEAIGNSAFEEPDDDEDIVDAEIVEDEPTDQHQEGGE